jgi:acylphosphatase
MDEPSENCQHRRIVFHGRVQGVGFRYQTRDVARRHPVRGFVQNQPDGTVLLVVEGEPHALDQVLEAVRSTMAANIRSDSVSIGTCTDEFQNFSIRY